MRIPELTQEELAVCHAWDAWPKNDLGLPVDGWKDWCREEGGFRHSSKNQNMGIHVDVLDEAKFLLFLLKWS